MFRKKEQRSPRFGERIKTPSRVKDGSKREVGTEVLDRVKRFKKGSISKCFFEYKKKKKYQIQKENVRVFIYSFYITHSTSELYFRNFTTISNRDQKYVYSPV